MQSRWHTAHVLALLAILAGCGKNGPPELLPLAPQTAYVGSRFELTIKAFDPDGDTLAFSCSSPTLELNSDRARLYNLGGEAVFSWTPIASEVGSHQIDFTADDGEATDQESIVLEVKSSTNPDTAPIFRQPLGEGTTLDLSVSKCMQLDVLVEDPDSTKVDVSQDPIITGSKLEHTGPLQARFSWCPTQAQTSQAIFVLRLVADDHDNPIVRKNFTILVRSDLPQNCPGSAPVIQHTAPPSQTTQDPIGLSATVADDKGLKSAPVVYVTQTKPANPAKLDYATMVQVAMTAASGTTSGYQATLANPTTTLNPGESATLYYVIVAEDDDDPSGSCDHRTQLPASDLFQVKITRPTGSCTTSAQCATGQMCQSLACVADTCTTQDTNGDQLFWEQSTCPASHICPVNGNATTSHCALSCTSDGDCLALGTVCKVFDTKPACGKAGSKVVGRECGDFTECAGKAMCLPWPKGYCSISDCDSWGGYSGACPTGSACIPIADSRFSSNKHWVCLQLCKDNSNCRTGDGYGCQAVTDDQAIARYVCSK